MSRRRGRFSRAKKKMPPPKFQQLSCKLRSSKTAQPRKRKSLFKSNKQKRTRKFKESKSFDEKSDENSAKSNDATVLGGDAPLMQTKANKGGPNSDTLKIQNEKTNLSENDLLEEGPLMIVVPEETDGESESRVIREENLQKIDGKNRYTPTENDNRVLADENQSTTNRVEGETEKNVTEQSNLSAEKTDMNDSSSKNTCKVCNIITDSSSSLTQHMKQHSITNNQTHQCLICSKSLSSASSLDRHMLVHSGERPFKCKLCDMSFTTNGNMHRHMRTHGEFELTEATTSLELRKKEKNADHESLTSEEQLYCPVCGKSFLCNYGLLSHMETHPNDPIICQKCKIISVNYSAHVEHKCNTQVTNTLPPNSVSQGFHDLTFMDFTCNKFSLVSKSYCEKVVKSPSSAFHIFQCSECKKSFPCGRALKLHQKIHGNNIGTFCPSCQCDFAAASFLQSHQLKHRSAEHCQQSTPEEMLHEGKEDFLALLNLQTKESQLTLLKNMHACNIKEDNFENMDYFVHGKVINKAQQNDSDGINSGSNNNDFADIQSIISLTSKAPLITPAQTSLIAARPASPLPYLTSRLPKSPEAAEPANSSPETPSKELMSMCNKVVMPDAQTPVLYSCNVCSQQFRNIGTLNRHCKLHIQRGSNYSCHLCSYVSIDKSTLIRHLRTHNGERPFQCVICKYAFTTKANCERHVRKRHKKVGKAEIRNAMQYNPNMAMRGAEQSSEIGNTETVCKYCGVDFKFNRVLRHHLRSLHNSCNRKPFSCKICKFGFSTKNNCIRHVLKQHPNLKDKLRSVVVSNSLIMQMRSPEKNVHSEDSDSSSTNQPATEDVQPLDLQSKAPDRPLDSKADKNTHATEAVIAAEGLVSLSEAQPLQNEPLDLAAHPLDLSCKPLAAVTKKTATEQNTILSAVTSSSSSSASGSIDLSLAKPSIAENQLPAEKMMQQELCNPDKIQITYAPSSQKLRSFTCIYCKAGFTLKSNMERHIKRKHPEYARPTRSRNYIPSIVTPSLQKQNSATLSDKTRDALRNVLNNKVQQIPVLKALSADTLSKLVPFKILGKTSSFIPQPKKNNLSTTVNLSLDLSGKTKTVTVVDMNSKSAKLPGFNEECCSDLASVSSVICTANSPQFKQYLEKPGEIEKSISSQCVVKKVLDESNTKKGEMPAVSCPFCDRRFPWSSSLRRHILTHTGQKPFKCPKCALWFTTKSNCERHLIRKHGHKGDLITRSVPDRPYKCNHCLTSTFSTQGNLRKHFYLKHWTKSYLGMNNKPNQTGSAGDESQDNRSQTTSQEHSYSQSPKHAFPCNFCSAGFMQLNELGSHILKHPNVAYMCHLCKKLFPSPGVCLCHYKEVHPRVYKQIGQKESSRLGAEGSQEVQDGVDENQNHSVACLLCFQEMSSYEALQEHFAVHLFVENSSKEESELVSEALKDVSKPDVQNSENFKKLKISKSQVKNSLLYLFTQNSSSGAAPSKLIKPHAKLDLSAQEENSDLIQNLLGIHDSKMIDEMLVSADSAARLLGVKEV